MARSLGPKSKSRDVSKQETRDALITAAMAEFAEHGIDGPSLDAICARAGFTRGAFYVHFKDREDLLVSAMEKILVSFFDVVIATGNEEADLAQTITQFAAAVAAGAPLTSGHGMVRFHHILEACVRSPLIGDRFVSLLGEAIARVGQAASDGQRVHSVRSDVPSEIIGALLVAIAMGLIAMIETKIPFDLAAIQAAALRLLAPPKG